MKHICTECKEVMQSRSIMGYGHKRTPYDSDDPDFPHSFVIISNDNIIEGV